MKKLTNTMRIDALENRMDNIESKLDLILNALENNAKSAPKATKKNAGKSVTKKSAPKADKPKTRTEAIAAWEKAKGITPESKAQYKEYYAREYAARWDKWTASKERNNLKGEALKRRNREKSAQIIADIKRDWNAMNA